MRARRDWFASQEELRAPTDEDIAEATRRVTPAARMRFMDAARDLTAAKMASGDRTPWRDLIEAYRQTEPMRVEVQVVDDGGEPRVQIAYIERGYGLKGYDAIMFSAVSELARAIEQIEQERLRNSLNGRGTEEKRGGRKSQFSPEAIRDSLARVISKNPPERLLRNTISWIAIRVRDDWKEKFGPKAPSPSDSTLRPYISEALPAHPGLRSTRKNGGSE